MALRLVDDNALGVSLAYCNW